VPGSSSLVVAIVEDISEKKAAEENLEQSEKNLQHLAGRLIQAQEEERQRIGRELHDDIGQRFSLLISALDNLRYSLAETGQNSQSQLVSELQQKADALATDIRNLSGDLHSSKLEFVGLYFALRNLCEKISRQQNVPITLHIEEPPANPPPNLELCIYRIAQEALNNVVKHSRTTEAFVKLTYENGTIVLKVGDRCVGFDPSIRQRGIGLASMRERLRVLGGELSVESILGKGTTVIAKVQLEKTQSAATA
jgi:signal transduction histidine kinase